MEKGKGLSSLSCRGGGTRPRICWRAIVGGALIRLQPSLLSLGGLRLRMGLGSNCVISGFGDHEGTVQHDVSVILAPIKRRLLIGIFVVKFVPVSLPWIHVRWRRVRISFARSKIPPIDHQTTTAANTSSKRGYSAGMPVLLHGISQLIPGRNGIGGI